MHYTLEDLWPRVACCCWRRKQIPLHAFAKRAPKVCCRSLAQNPHASLPFKTQIFWKTKPLEFCREEHHSSQKMSRAIAGNCNIFEEDIKQPDYSVSGCQGQAWNPHAYNSRLNLLENKPLELCRIEQRFSQKGVEQLGPEPTGNCNIFEKKKSNQTIWVVLCSWIMD